MKICKIVKKCYFLEPLVAAVSRHRGRTLEWWWCCFDSDSDSDSDTDSDSWLLTDSDPDSDSWFVAATLDNIDSDSNSEPAPEFWSRGGAVPATTPTPTAGF